MSCNPEILIVDDNVVNVQIMEEILQDDYSLYVAFSIEQARQTLFSHNPALILLDVMLPDGNGYDFCKELRGTHGDSLVIIIVSARAMEEDVRKGYQAGANEYVTKPFSEENMRTAVCKYLPIKKESV